MRNLPGEVEIEVSFKAHAGARMVSAGLRIQFHYNQVPGIHFKGEPPKDFGGSRDWGEWIVRGLQDGLALRFPDFPDTGSIWITSTTVDPVESAPAFFYQAARMAIDAAHARVAAVPPSDLDR